MVRNNQRINNNIMNNTSGNISSISKLSFSKPKILAPAGDFISLRAAIDAGCDEVYFGVKGFNMRAGAENFSVADLPKVVKTCHDANVKANLAINTIIYENEDKNILKILKAAKNANIDGIIAWDMAVIDIASKLNLSIHLSTQASVCNYQSLDFYKAKIRNLKRVILARECSLDDIKSIIRKIRKNKLDVEIETFIHGAMCVSISGRCFLSQEIFGKSANRGECIQPCRRLYKAYSGSASTKDCSHLIKDSEENHELILGEDYVMSPKDLCTLPFIEMLIDAGISAFKIEGRNRNPEYVSTVVSCYREIVDYYSENKKLIAVDEEAKKKFHELKKSLLKKLETVYNRGFSSGFYLGKPSNEWSGIYGSRAKEHKQYVGKVMNYYSNISVAEVKVESFPLSAGEIVLFLGPTTGVLRLKADEMRTDNGTVKTVKKGDLFTIKTSKKVRMNDLLYKIVERK